jgi:hypothetical protein
MSPERQAELQASLAQLNAEWIAFQRVHKILPKPPGLRIPANSVSASLPYGQGKLWSAEDHKRESDRMEFAERNNRKN